MQIKEQRNEGKDMLNQSEVQLSVVTISFEENCSFSRERVTTRRHDPLRLNANQLQARTLSRHWVGRSSAGLERLPAD